MTQGVQQDEANRFPVHYREIFLTDDAGVRFRLMRSHVHPKLRGLLSAMLDELTAMGFADPLAHSRMAREPVTPGLGTEFLTAAHYGLRPQRVQGGERPRVRSSSGRVARDAEFELGFFASAAGVGLEFFIGGMEALDLFEHVYKVHREDVDALLLSNRLGVDGPTERCLVSARGMIREARRSGEGWLAIFDPPAPYPLSAEEALERFRESFVALYMLYDAMLARAHGRQDSFLALRAQL
jgi:hypothetical protein